MTIANRLYQSTQLQEVPTEVLSKQIKSYKNLVYVMRFSGLCIQWIVDVPLDGIFALQCLWMYFCSFGLLYYLPSLCVCVSLSIWIAAAPDTLQTRTQINRSCKTGKVQRYVESSVFGNLWVSDVMSLFPPSCILIHICGKFEVINSPKLSYSKDIRFVFDVWSNPCRFLCSCSKIKTRGHAEWTDLDRSQNLWSCRITVLPRKELVTLRN